MGQAARTTKLLLDFSKKKAGGANAGKRAYLEETVALLNKARAFYVDFLLAHPDCFHQKVLVQNKETKEWGEQPISSNRLLTWTEAHTVATSEHPTPDPGWNFSEQFPQMPYQYRRSVIKDSLGRVKAYLTATEKWKAKGAKKGKPGLPAPRNHPTLYEGLFTLELTTLDLRETFARFKVYTGKQWIWANYPTHYNRYFEKRRAEGGWEEASPKLILGKQSGAIHVLQTKAIKAKKIVESKLDPDLVTVAVDVNVRYLAVVTVRQHGKILETVFVADHGLDQHRYRHMKRIAKKQWQSGKPVKGERSNQDLWRHVKRMNEDAAHRVSRKIVDVCAKYAGCVLIFERLRVMKQGGMSKSHRLNRKQANQVKGKINQYSKEKAYAVSIVTVETNAHGTSQHCSRCGAKGERFSIRSGKPMKERGGKLFRCLACGYQAHADFNASANVQRSFWREYHWQPRPKKGKKPPPALSRYR